MPVRNLDALFRPNALALVTDESEPAGLAHVLVRNLFDAGLKGPILPVSRDKRALEGVLAYPSLAALPLVPDLVVAAAPHRRLPALIQQSAKLGARALLAVSLGGARIDEASRNDLRKLARRTGIRLMGPDSLGVMVPAHGLNATLAPVFAPPGRLALISQSGMVANSVLDWAQGRAIGFSAVAAGGTMADIDLGDLLDFLAMDAATRAILLYVEHIGDPRPFLSAARIAARSKPVIAFRPGGRDDEDRTWDAVFQRCGVLRVRELEELFAAAETLSLARPVGGERLSVVANGGGLGLVAADALAARGGVLARPEPRLAAKLRPLVPGNGGLAPVDLGGDAGPLRYAKVVDLLAADSGNDAILVLHGPSAVVAGLDVAEAVADSAAKAKRCVLTCWLGNGRAQPARSYLAERHVPSYDTPAQAVRAFLHAVEYRRGQEALAQTPPSVPEDFTPNAGAARAIIAGALAAGRERLELREAQAVLACFGLEPLPSLHLRIVEDPCFGPVLRVAPAAAPEAFVAALPPLTMHLAAEALRRAKLPTDPQAALALVKLSQLALDLPEVVELAVAPALLDMRVRPWQGDPLRRLAIRPYPKHLEAPLPLPDGRRLLIRPVLPEDEPQLEGLFQRMSAEAVRLRFFAPRRSLGHAVGARLSQLDFERDMGFVVADPGRPGAAALHGIAHLTSDADKERGEFAIMVAGDMVGLGLGPMLMRRILDHARAEGLAEVFGDVLRENVQMLKLCQALGFKQSANRDEPEVLHVRCELRS